MDKETRDNLFMSLEQIKAEVRRCKKLVENEYNKNME